MENIKYQHIITIRVNNYALTPKKYRYSAEYLNKAYYRLKNCVLPSLVNQIDKKFIIVLLFGDDFIKKPIYHKYLDKFIELRSLFDSYNDVHLEIMGHSFDIETQHFISYKPSIDFENIIKEQDYLILSRLDYDDFLFQFATYHIKNLFLTNYNILSQSNSDYFYTGFDWHYIFPFDQDQISEGSGTFKFKYLSKIKINKYEYFDSPCGVVEDADNERPVFSSLLLTLCVNKLFVENNIANLLKSINHKNSEVLKTITSNKGFPNNFKAVHDNSIPVGIHSFYNGNGTTILREQKISLMYDKDIKPNENINNINRAK